MVSGAIFCLYKLFNRTARVKLELRNFFSIMLNKQDYGVPGQEDQENGNYLLLLHF